MSMRAAFIPELILGEVTHHRRRPAEHELSYPVFSLRLPLSAMTRLPGLGLPVNRFGWVAFNEGDHGRRDGSALLPWIREILERHHAHADGEIELVCFPRMLGYAFKPVSFWICRDAAGAVRAVLAEVHNTFGEAHNYLLVNADGSALRSGQTLSAPKVFHVSPFLEVKGEYTFRFHFGPGRFLARIDYADATGTVLTTRLSGKCVALTRSNLRQAALRFPFQAMVTTVRIHWNALLLWWKSVPHFAKPHPPLEEPSR
jgi:DUF1365 family protein